jgi:hypothetical protein
LLKSTSAALFCLSACLPAMAQFVGAAATNTVIALDILADGGPAHQAAVQQNLVAPMGRLDSQVNSSNSGSQESWQRNAQASGTAQMGTLTANAYAQWSAPAGALVANGSESSSAQASASFEDYVTISAPGRAGSAGAWTGLLALDGHGAVTIDSAGLGAGAAVVDVTVYLPGVQPAAAFGACSEGSANNACLRITGAAAGPWVLPFSIPFVYGQPIDLVVSLSVNATASQVHCTDCNLVALGFLSAAWGGTTGVLDPFGHAVAGYTITSQSGFDYRLASPVPQPSSAALMLSGSLAVTLFALRRRRALLRR